MYKNRQAPNPLEKRLDRLRKNQNRLERNLEELWAQLNVFEEDQQVIKAKLETVCSHMRLKQLYEEPDEY